jgi:hypothetical protein
MIKKAALSLIVTGASGAYVWTQSDTQSSDDLAEAPPAAASALPEAVAAVAVEPPLIVRDFANSGDKAATAPFPKATAVKVQSISIDPAAAIPPPIAALFPTTARAPSSSLVPRPWSTP